MTQKFISLGVTYEYDMYYVRKDVKEEVEQCWTKTLKTYKESQREGCARGQESFCLAYVWNSPTKHTHTDTHSQSARPPGGLLAMLAEIQLHFCWQPEENNWPITTHQNAGDMYDFSHPSRIVGDVNKWAGDHFISVSAVSGVKFDYTFALILTISFFTVFWCWALLFLACIQVMKNHCLHAAFDVLLIFLITLWCLWIFCPR